MGASLAVAIVGTVTGWTAGPASAQAAAAAVPALTRLHTSGSAILDGANQAFRIKAANWFGLETQACAPHGLWQLSLDSGMAQIAGFGFNALRLPYSNECIEKTTAVTNIDFSKNPGLVGKTPIQVMDAVIASAAAHGLRVILDRHRPDSNSQSPLWYTPAYPESTWKADWVMLANRYVANPAVIGADLHNEPNGAACWGCGDPARDWAAAATRVGNAVLAADPHLLVIVEGVGQSAAGDSSWWGGQLADVAAHPVNLSVAHQLVYSAHDYPASIYPQPWFSARGYPSNLPEVWDSHFGYLQKQNIAPVLLGEFGTKLQTTSDQQWLATLVTYLNSTKMSFAYWSFNPNSGDTGGLVQDDWVTPQLAKLAALAPLLGGTVPTSTVPTSTVPTSTAPTSTAPTSTAPTSTAPTSTAPTTSATPSPTVKPTTTTTPAPTGTTPSGPSAGRVAASWTLQSSWNAGYVAQLTISAKTAVAGWTISWPDPGATSVVNAWGISCTVASGRINCRGADWAAAIEANGQRQVGLQVAGNGTAPSRPIITIG